MAGARRAGDGVGIFFGDGPANIIMAANVGGPASVAKSFGEMLA